jgi:hypothetical protein
LREATTRAGDSVTLVADHNGAWLTRMADGQTVVLARRQWSQALVTT